MIFQSLQIMIHKILVENFLKKGGVFGSCMRTLEEIKETEIRNLNEFIEKPIQYA